MKLLVLSCVFILVAVLFPRTKLMGQVSQVDSVFYQSAVYNAIAFYQQSTQDQPRIYNGRRYKPYRMGFLSGTPFYQSDLYTAGSVIYEDGVYENVKLLYDQVADMLILQGYFGIELISERVAQFTLYGHTFNRLVQDSVNNLPASGFYEKLYKGRIEILKKEKKIIKENLSDTEGVRGEISGKIYYYLKKNGLYYLIKNQRTVFELMKDRQSEIQHFMKSNNLNFKKDKENTLTKIAGYYDQLTR